MLPLARLLAQHLLPLNTPSLCSGYRVVVRMMFTISIPISAFQFYLTRSILGSLSFFLFEFPPLPEAKMAKRAERPTILPVAVLGLSDNFFFVGYSFGMEQKHEKALSVVLGWEPLYSAAAGVQYSFTKLSIFI
jgi:hypothetical protein